MTTPETPKEVEEEDKDTKKEEEEQKNYLKQ